MILGQLEEFRPQLTKRLVKRSLKQARARTRKAIVRRTLRTKRVTLALIRRQYYLTDALADTRVASRRNEDIVFASLLALAGISFALASILANMLFVFMQSAAGLSVVTGISLGLLALVAIGVLTVLSAWVLAMLLNTVSLAIMDGATRKRYRSLRVTMRRGLAQASRVACAWLALAVVAAGPLLAAALAAVLLRHVIRLTHLPLPYLIGLAMVFLGWLLYALANFSLVPHVALFEPAAGWREVFARSRRLVRRRGRLFILSGYLTLTTLMAAAYGLALGLQYLTHISSTLTFIILAWGIIVLGNSVATIFYRKRKLARR